MLAVLLCGSGFGVELWRALGGNTLSWAYTVEWPLLLGYGVYMWRRLVAEAKGSPSVAHATDSPRRARAEARRDRRAATEDAAREEYNAYLARVHGARGAERP